MRIGFGYQLKTNKGAQMTKHIEFIPSSKKVSLVVPKPKPAKLYIPDWYKKIEITKDHQFDEFANVTTKSLKNCMPFLDALTHGYIQETWTDIYISVDDNGGISYTHAIDPPIMAHRNGSPFSVGSMYYPHEFVWLEPWVPKMPDGYSVLLTQPFNNFNLPFKVLDAVIDADKYHHGYNGNYPFYIYKGFSGLIPAGTPMFQIVPIKRESWESHASAYDEDANLIRHTKLKKHLFNSYQKSFWQRKSFR
jgi:hypothetical protein